MSDHADTIRWALDGALPTDAREALPALDELLAEIQRLHNALERIEAIRQEWDTFDNRIAQGFDFIEAFWRALGIARAALAAVRMEDT